MSKTTEKLLKMSWVEIEKEFEKLSTNNVKEVALCLLEKEYERQYLKNNPPLTDEEKNEIIQAYLNGKEITSWNEGLGNPVMRYLKDEVPLLELIRDLEDMHIFEHFVIEGNSNI